MTRITISCPITWYLQCDWIRNNCKNWKDDTCWAAWQIGYDDIYFDLEEADAIEFLLRWS